MMKERKFMSYVFRFLGDFIAKTAKALIDMVIVLYVFDGREGGDAKTGATHRN